MSSSINKVTIEDVVHLLKNWRMDHKSKEKMNEKNNYIFLTISNQKKKLIGKISQSDKTLIQPKKNEYCASNILQIIT